MADYRDSWCYKQLSEEGIKRLDVLASRVSTAFGTKVQDCFVSEIRDEEGKTSYPNFVFFSDRGITECADPMGKDYFDIAPLEGRVVAIDIKCTSFDFQNAIGDSRLTAEVWLGATGPGGWYITFRAAGESCKELSRIIRERLIPNLAGAQG